MAISYVGGATSSGGAPTTLTTPTHQVGDLIVIAAFSNSSGIPALGDGSTFTSITTGSAGGAGIRIAYRIATSTSTTAGSWAGASRVACHVYRGAHATSPIAGFSTVNLANSTTFTWPAIGGNNATGWIAMFGFVNYSLAQVLSNPSGMTQRTELWGAGGGDSLSCDDGPRSTQRSASNQTLSSSYSWGSVGIEIAPQPSGYTLTADTTSVSVSGTSAGVKRGYRLPATSANASVTPTSANLKYGRRVAAASGAIAVTGQAATFPTPARVQYIGSATVLGATVSAMPAHQAGDLIIGFAWRNNSTTNPAIPSGFTNLAAGAVGTTSAANISYKIATSSSEDGGTWTGATALDIHVYRGVNPLSAIGAKSVNTGTSTTLGYNALTLQNTHGKSWVVAFGAHQRTDQTGMATPPAGAANRSSIAGSGGEVAGHDTGAVTSWAGGNVSVGGTSGDWATYVAEILFGYTPLIATSASFTVTPTAANLKADRRQVAASVTISVTPTAATLRLARNLPAASLSVSIAPTAAGVLRGYRLPAASASIAVTPTTAALKIDRKLPADSASLSVAGTPVAFGLSFTFAADSASIALTTAAASLRADRKLSAASASVSATATAAGLVLGRKILPDSASIAVSGTTAGLRATRTMSVASASITITPQSALIYKTLLLPADSAAITITASNVVLRKAKLLAADSAVITLADGAADLRVGRKILADSDAIAIDPTAIVLRRGLAFAVDAAAVSLASSDAGLLVGRKLTASPAAVSLTGSAITLRNARRIAATAAALGISPTLAHLLAIRRLAALQGQVTIDGGEAFMTVGLLPGNVVFKWFDGGRYVTAQLKIKTADGWTPVSVSTT